MTSKVRENTWLRLSHCGKVARSNTEHKKDPGTEEARRKSGNSSHGKHGLTEDEERIRQEKRYHRGNYYWALKLDGQLHASKSIWYEMSHNDWWYIQELRSGALLAAMRRADNKCSKVRANNFFVHGA